MRLPEADLHRKAFFIGKIGMPSHVVTSKPDFS